MRGFNPAADRRMSVPGAVAAPKGAFSFWSSMGDLVRLVLRSRAKGLKTRLSAALALVLLGKLTGVIGPLLIQGAIDRLNHGRTGGEAVFVAFAGLVLGWV
ncbi:MAG: metal ABC transporter permease, partial [Caulobacteraceae bacterium]